MVADFEGTYHAILGRPALTKFMALPHYRYLVLKIPIKKGVLALHGNVYTAYLCEDDSYWVPDAHGMSLRMTATTSTMELGQEIPKARAARKHAKSKEHKEIQLVEGDASKTVLIGANLERK